MSWFTFPGFGLIDLSVTWDPDWPQVLEAGWGLFMTLLIGVPFTVIAVGQRSSWQAAVTQLYVASGALVVSAVVAAEGPLVIWAIVIAIEAMVVAGLPSRRRPSLPPWPGWQPLMVPAALGVIPWLAYAIAMWDLNRQDRPDTDITLGIDHYAMQGALGLAVIGLVTVAAVGPVGRLLMGTCAGLSALYLGVVSWAWHPTQGSVSRTWSAVCVLWGVIVIVLAALTRQRRRRQDQPDFVVNPQMPRTGQI